MLAVVVVAVAAFMAFSTVVGLTTFYGGFVFVFYYTGVCQAAPGTFLPAVVGAFVGLALAFGLVALPAALGGAGRAVALILLLVAIYALIMGWATVAINNAAMLFLTVASIPALNQTATIVQMALSAGLAMVLIGVVLGAARVRGPKAA